jgi:hypothetical protein
MSGGYLYHHQSGEQVLVGKVDYDWERPDWESIFQQIYKLVGPDKGIQILLITGFRN